MKYNETETDFLPSFLSFFLQVGIYENSSNVSFTVVSSSRPIINMIYTRPTNCQGHGLKIHLSKMYPLHLNTSELNSCIHRHICTYISTHRWPFTVGQVILLSNDSSVKGKKRCSFKKYVWKLLYSVTMRIAVDHHTCYHFKDAFNPCLA